MRILVVDDDRFIREILSAIIEDAGHTPILAGNDNEALPILEEDKIDLVLMDVEMPGLNGFDLTKEIRRRYTNNWFPIIFLSSQNDEKHYEKGIRAGGDDYLTKPVSPIVLKAKIHAMERIASMKQSLDDANTRLQKLSSLDPLTRISNRRALDKNLLKAWKLRQQHDNEMCAIMLDIDFFKPYNDNYGHQQGDECLKRIAKTMRTCLKKSPQDILARYGGEEFAIILPDTSLVNAKKVATRIIETLWEENIPHEFSGTADRVTASIGISSTTFKASTPAELIKQADTALYEAKDSGRNRHVTFSS